MVAGLTIAVRAQSFPTSYEHGLECGRAGDFRCAAAELQKAVQLNPSSSNANRLLALAWLKLGKAERALLAARRAVRISPHDEAAKIVLASALLDSARPAEARLLFLEIARHDVPEAWFGVAKSSLMSARAASRRLESASSIYSKLIRLKRTRDEQEASRYVSELATSQPVPPGTWEALGEYAFSHDDLTQARAYLANALRDSPWSVRSAFGLGCVDLAQAHIPAAIEAFKQAAAINSEWVRLRGAALISATLLESLPGEFAKQFKDAQVPANKTEAPPLLRTCLNHEVPAACWVGAGFVEIGDTDAVKVLSSIRSTSPSDLYWQAIGFEQLSAMALDQLMKPRADAGRALTLAAEIFLSLEYYERASDLLKQALSAEPSNGEAWTVMGKVQRHNVEFDAAERSLLKGFELGVIDAEAQFMLGEIYARKHEPAKAFPFLQRSVDLHPPSDALREILAKVYSQLGHDQEAIGQLLEIPAERRTAPVVYQLFQAYQKTGQSAHARDALAAYRRLKTGGDSTDRPLK